MPDTNRRHFMKAAAAVSLLGGVSANADAARVTSAPNGKRPNIVLYVADQLRHDFIGASGLNASVQTPNLDAIARRGAYFTHAVTNQPLCSPGRACLMTGRYATETGVWELGRELDHSLPTLASVLKQNGYSTNFIGKWHLCHVDNEAIRRGDRSSLEWVPPGPRRGGFDDLWEGANVLELISHPYEGTIWDNSGKPLEYHDEYRVDFLTERAVNFLKQPGEKPFFLFLSQLEPHDQNDEHRPVAPKGYADRYKNPFIPPDLMHLPGGWQEHLPDYYGCIQKIDESVGTILKTLESQGLLENTIFIFTSDHGNHFETRNRSHKQSPHDSSIRVPLLVQGPGVNHSQRLNHVVGNIDVAPTLLDLCGVEVPGSMKGKSLRSLIQEPASRETWKNEALIQISSQMTGRAIRTQEWTYCIAAPASNKRSSSDAYQEYALYNNFGGPAQIVNLIGRPSYKEQTKALRNRLLEMIAESGETQPSISPALYYYD